MDLNQTFNLLVDKLQGWLDALILALPNLVAAVLIVIGFAFAARLVRRLIVSGMDRVSAYRQVNKLLGTIGYLGVLAAGVFIALGILDLDKTVTSLLAGAGIIGLALGFAFQDIATNFISGILLSIRRPFTEGDIIESNGYLGTVADVNLRSTKLRTFQGPLVIIPNKEIFQNPLTNYSELGQRRVDLSCGVAYGDDLDKARRVALEALEGLDVRDPNRPVELFYNAFGDSSINFTARFWIDFRKQTDFLHAQSEAIMRLKRAFDEHGITIPFPIRTLDFGVVGGEKLSDVLPPSLYATSPANGS
ncbi:mechanosensitive ion channel protein MscS [Rhodothermaceae bacterium RA]|nr:mechanosensitive ion channel protein MscS [Rhodothermaceae bacterium RA]